MQVTLKESSAIKRALLAVGDDSGPLHCARAIRRRGREITGKDNERQGENHG